MFRVVETVDVVTLEGSSDRFRLLYDVKGRFVLHRVDEKEAQVCYVECGNV